MNAEEIKSKFPQEGPWSYDALVQKYKEFLDRGKYFPKENRDANHLLECRGKDMLGMSDEYIKEVIKNNCAEAFVGKMVRIELWR